jgi:hypothetical protein
MGPEGYGFVGLILDIFSSHCHKHLFFFLLLYFFIIYILWKATGIRLIV